MGHFYRQRELFMIQWKQNLVRKQKEGVLKAGIL